MEISFWLAGDDAASLDEVVGWDLAGSTGVLVVGGEAEYERRLVAKTKATLSRAQGIDAHHIDILTIRGDAIHSRRRMVLP